MKKKVFLTLTYFLCVFYLNAQVSNPRLNTSLDAPNNNAIPDGWFNTGEWDCQLDDGDDYYLNTQDSWYPSPSTSFPNSSSFKFWILRNSFNQHYSGLQQSITDLIVGERYCFSVFAASHRAGYVTPSTQVTLNLYLNNTLLGSEQLNIGETAKTLNICFEAPVSEGVLSLRADSLDGSLGGRVLIKVGSGFFKVPFPLTSVNNQEQLENSISLFPNPTDGQLTLQLSQAIKGQLTLFDLSGKTLLTRDINSTDTSIELDLESFPDHIYLYSILTEDGSLISGKFFKK